MSDQSKTFEIRAMATDEWDEVARLIHDSTNAWYESQGKPKIFTAGPSSTRLFCEVYEALDPECCLVAVESATSTIAGSCFYHPRPTHVALGIMNVHPGYFGRGIARQLLAWITSFADESKLPVRLVSSAMNLDSFSLYNRAGFIPSAVYQDMFLSVPESGFSPSSGPAEHVRLAQSSDVAEMVALEMELVGVNRTQDFQYFIENTDGIWKTLVLEDSAGQLDGFLVSVRHPGSALIGPGVMRDEDAAIALVHAATDHHRGSDTVIVTPATAPKLVASLYKLGARNCELHLGQVRGEARPITGIVIPTFMPETA